MRVVRDLADLQGEIAKAQAEAASAFGDGTVFVEPYVERGRHVEVQVVGTADGVLVLGERDCSLQRRHQKVVEEAPAPGLSDEVRSALHEAARAAAAAMDYRGAGTVEFLYDPASARFFFLEMNTRLQVEHPVTELVHGVDLVELQLEVAETGSCASARPGASSGTRPARPHRRPRDRGPAVRRGPGCRPPAAERHADHLRAPRRGRRSGSTPATSRAATVSTHYDAMLAKVIAHAATRDQAARQLAGVLERARIHGVVTNRDQLVRVLRDETFLAGEVSTAFLSGWSRLASRPPRPTGRRRRGRAGHRRARRGAPARCSAASRSRGATSRRSRR